MTKTEKTEEKKIIQIDQNILLWIQDHLRKPKLDRFMKSVTSLGNFGAVWLVVTALLLSRKKTRGAGAMSGIALTGSVLVNNLCLKNLVDRIRPYEKLEDLKILIRPSFDASFPSGHTGSSVAVAWVMAHELSKAWGRMAETLAFLIAFSRLYVGIHYPSDVLGGVATGIFTGEMARKIYYRYSRG